MVHSYNAWLPARVADEMDVETERFHILVEHVQDALRINTLESRLDSLQWISVVNTFLKAKSELLISDLESFVQTALSIILTSSDSLYIQTRWANCLSYVLSKYRKKLNLEIDWHPLYNLIQSIHFERRHSYEGLSLKHSHLQNIVYLTEICRRFFKMGSCAEVWSEFRPKLEDISHNSALEAAGFLSLFLSTNSEKRMVTTNQSFFNRVWLEECLKLWSLMPTCHFWNVQWASLLSRCIKHRVLTPSDWEPFLPELFRNFLNGFDVPVAKIGVWCPVYQRIPSEIKSAFQTRWSPGLSALSAKSIVYLLGPQSLAQEHFSTMVDLLEQYYHPSNGGTWTGSLQRFLRLLVFYFMKRLEAENCECKKPVQHENLLGQAERAAFVTTVMKLIDRGQYSKNGALAWTAASAASRLAYVEPDLVLPMVVTRFQMALNTVTATHQLESALRMLALSVRPMLIYDAVVSNDSTISLKKCLTDAMFSTLPGLDANDPPKTISTMQFYCCVLSSVENIDSEDKESTSILPINWSLWVDEFLDRLFALFVNLEPSLHSSNENSSGVGFLIESGSPYSCLIDLLFAKLNESQYSKALRRTSKFVTGNILPGAVEEIGSLCCSIVYVNPNEASVCLLAPIMESLISSLSDSPKTGFGRNDDEVSVVDFKVGLSPALEMTARYFLGVLSKAILNGGSALLGCKYLLQQVILASFDAPSSKVNDAGSSLLTSAIGTLALYYPVNVFKSSLRTASRGCEDWVAMKSKWQADRHRLESLWHAPSQDELFFVNEIMNDHLIKPLGSLKKIAGGKECYKSKYAGQEKEHLRVLLLRIEGTLCGLGSCLPDFNSYATSVENGRGPLTVVGAAGATVGTSKLREEISEIIHQVCDYIMLNRGDDSVLLKILVSIIDIIGNYGSIEYNLYHQMKSVWDENARLLTEPCTNFVNKSFSVTKRRPWRVVIERTFIHNLWRASQCGYRRYNAKEMDLSVSPHMLHLLDDLLKLSLHSYSSIRTDAGRSLKNMLQRYPFLVKKCMPSLTQSLQDPKATKESALGSCEILMSIPVLQYLRQDWTGLASFLLALLGSAHHESVEAQDAIHELFIMFNTSFGGVPVKVYTSQQDNESMSYTSMVSYIRDLLKGESITIHWRYNLMAHGILLCLVLPVTDNDDSTEDIFNDLRHSVTGGFLDNLKSELPPLRPLSVVALLFLLEGTSPQDMKNRGLLDVSCEEMGKTEIPFHNGMSDVLGDQKFGEKMVNKLAIDRQSGEEDGYSLQYTSNVGLTDFMPTHMREWPHTQTWDVDMKGDQFSPTFSKLFKRLVQKFGSIVLKLLREPLESILNATEDRGKQCIAAEIMAGLLHSDDDCVLTAWEDWIRPLFQKFLILPTLDSASEWAACIRFAVGGKGRCGNRVPILRHKILQCVADCTSEKSSTTLIARKLMFLRAALVELLPRYSSPEEIMFQSGLLKDVLCLCKHSSPQVRRSLGSVLCLLLSNIHIYSMKHQIDEDIHVKHVSEQTCTSLIHNAMEATKFIIKTNNTALAAKEDETWKKKTKDCVKEMETILYFLISIMRSGRAHIMINVVIRLIYPTLSLQETSEKDLSSLARNAMRFLQWQAFPISHLSEVVEVMLTAANDDYWHTRVAFLTFLQPFIYRHKFSLSNIDQQRLWEKVKNLLSDPQLEVREAATRTIAGMLKGAETTFALAFRQKIVEEASLLRCQKGKRAKNGETRSIPNVHGVVLGLAAIVLSTPYDVPKWLPEIVTILAGFSNEIWPIRGTVTKTITDFRHTHSDMWEIQKDSFTEQQLEVLTNSASSATYFA